MKLLVVIPARGGSKGIPRKNVKLIDGRPLIHYAIEAARDIVTDRDICLTTDDIDIVNTAKEIGLEVPFIRPENIAGDLASMNDVLLHAYEYYRSEGIKYDTIVLLQPTSPFRTSQHIKEAIALYREDLDMVVSVTQPASNPFYVAMQEDDQGYLRKALDGKYTRRQDCPTVYEYNGAVYVININSLISKGMQGFDKNIKYEMDAISSHDLDNMQDWMYCEFLIERGLVKLNKCK